MLPSFASSSRTFSFLFAAAAAAVLSIHCGGRIDGDAPSTCPTNLNEACPTNAKCTAHVTDCGGARDVTCTCNGTGWSCPQTGACPNPCTNVTPGGSCSAEGTFCKTPPPPNCDLPPAGGCTCSNGKWTCSITICEDPPPPVPACPPPSAIHEGGSCVGNATCGGYLQCPQGGSANVSYDCVNGRWQMWEYFQDPCDTIEPDGGLVIVDGGKKGG